MDSFKQMVIGLFCSKVFIVDWTLGLTLWHLNYFSFVYCKSYFPCFLAAAFTGAMEYLRIGIRLLVPYALYILHNDYLIIDETFKTYLLLM